MTDKQRNGRAEGDRRKGDAHATIEAKRSHYLRLGRRALLMRLLAHGGGTADDVRSVVELPVGIDAKLFGAVPGLLARAGIIARDGHTKTNRPAAHARLVTIWRLANREAALQWLAGNPDPFRPPAGEQLPLFTTNEESPTAATVGLSQNGL